MELLTLISGLIYFLAFVLIFINIFRQSRFWVLFLSIEYFYFIGLGVFPLALVFGYANFPEELIAFGNLDTFSPLSVLHVLFYALGAIVGFYALPRLSRRVSAKLERYSYAIRLDSKKTLYIFLLAAYVALASYIYLVGAERVLLGAAMARGGVLDEFVGFESYLFLTRFVYFGVYAVAFLPFVMTQARYPLIIVAAFSILGIAGYFVLAARYMLFQCVLVPLLFYFAYAKRLGPASLVSLVCASALAGLGVFYGKELPTVVANYLFNNGDFEFKYSGEEVDFFKSFSQFFYSTDAGVRSFSDVGPYISKDIFLGPLGVLPSSVFSALGLDDFSYMLLDLDDRFSCLNTKIILGAYSSCFIPPYFVGASAYVMPLAGGFLFGLVRFLFYSAVSDCWRRMAGREHRLAVAVLIMISAEQLMLFIPNSAAFVVFVWIVIYILLFLGFIRSKV